MHNINILKYCIRSAQGNLSQTVEAIRNGNINLSEKTVFTDQDDIKIPYFLFEEKVQDDQDSIYLALKDLVFDILSELDEVQKKSTAMIIGTSIIDWYAINAIEDTLYDYKKTEYSSNKRGIDSYAQRLSLEFGLSSFTNTINTACTSSANALLEGANLIKSGLFEYVVVIGIEISSEIMSSGFNAMKLLSPSVIKPFDENREGLVLGEGITAVLIGNDTSPWSLLGGFSNCNSANITSVSKEGDEYIDVMKKALKAAELSTKDITVLKAHATGTFTNDLSEINAISRLFEEDIIFTALKPYIGHTLGACGALELAIFMSCIDKGFIPKTISCDAPILKQYKPIDEHKKCENGIFMLNYFGFGGNNTSLIIEKKL